VSDKDDDFNECFLKGTIAVLAEDEFGASFSDDNNNAFFEAFFEEYVKDGRPKKIKTWARKRLADVFKCVTNRPDWYGDDPEWPFVDGKPCIFISQLEVENTENGRLLGTERTLYLFAAKVIDPDGSWTLTYRVISRSHELRGLKITPNNSD